MEPGARLRPVDAARMPAAAAAAAAAAGTPSNTALSRNMTRLCVAGL